MPAKNRDLLDTNTGKRYVRRDDQGRLSADQVGVGKSSAADQRQHSKTASRPGQGDQGDSPKK